MKAVNLIGGKGAAGAGRGAGMAYALLGVLAVLVVGVAYSVLTSNTIAERRAQLAAVSTQAQTAQAQAVSMKTYSDFATLAKKRVDTIRQLGATRFDWHRSFEQLAKVLPSNVWLTSLLGTVTSGVSVPGASSGATSTLRGAMPNPAIELSGCTTSHDDVVRLISHLRLIDGVVRVSLADSTKGDSSSGGGGGGNDSGDCRHGHANYPQFDAVVFFEPLPVAPSLPGSAAATSVASTTPAASGGAAPAPSTAQPAAASTTPAASGTPSTGGNAR